MGEIAVLAGIIAWLTSRDEGVEVEPLETMSLAGSVVQGGDKKAAKPSPMVIVPGSIPPSGGTPLPKEAKDALKDGGEWSRGGWVYLGKMSKSRKRKAAKMRVYSSPPGALYMKTTDKQIILPWMMLAPSRLQQKYGWRDQGVRMKELTPVFGRKADLKSFAAIFGATWDSLPGLLEAAGGVTATVASGGAAGGFGGAVSAGGVVGQVSGALEQTLKNLGSVGGSISKRVKAANAIVAATGTMYASLIAKANPHLWRGGELELGKVYKSNPKTYGDLRKAGGSYPLVRIPEVNP